MIDDPFNWEPLMSNLEKIRVFSRRDAERFDPPKKYHAWISITTPGDDNAYIQLRKPYDVGIKRVAFHDIDDGEAGGVDMNGDPYIIPDMFSAREIYSFVRWNIMAIEELYIHCDAGISRSAGVAAALSKIFLGTDEEFFKAPYHPNRLIYRLILELHESQGNIGPHV
jgi:predicted protein tyrosine phosphatase